jgi:ABC-type branched-subunit amino acid transport system ATPase component
VDYGTLPVLFGVDLVIEPGEVVTLLERGRVVWSGLSVQVANERSRWERYLGV